MNFTDATEAQVARFSEILSKHNATECHSCGQPITLQGCVSIGGATEAGTSFSALSVACHNCGTEIVVRQSWYPEIEDVEEFLDALEVAWKDDR